MNHQRILVTGSRHWSDADAIHKVLTHLVTLGAEVLIHGNAAGADSIAASVAQALRMEVVSFPADWAKYGRGAGSRRNTQMLVEGKPDLVIAFPTADSIGTWDMVRKAKAAGLEVLVYRSKP